MPQIAKWRKWINKHGNEELKELFEQCETLTDIVKVFGNTRTIDGNALKAFKLYVKNNINLDVDVWRMEKRKMRENIWYKWVKENPNEVENLWKKHIHASDLMFSIGYSENSGGRGVPFDNFYNYCVTNLQMDLSWWNKRKDDPIFANNPKWCSIVREKTKEEMQKIWENNIYKKDIMKELGYNVTAEGSCCTTSFNHFYDYCIKYLQMNLSWWNERNKEFKQEQRIEALKIANESCRMTHEELMAILTNTNPELQNKRVSWSWLKPIIISMGLKEDKCELCERPNGEQDEYNGKKVYKRNGEPAIVHIETDHINGCPYDNRLIFDKEGNIHMSNIQFLCVGCHKNTDTHTGKGISNDSYSWREGTIIVDGKEVKYNEPYVEE